MQARAGQAGASRPIIKKYSEHIYFGFGSQAGLTSSIIVEYTATKIKDEKFHPHVRPALKFHTALCACFSTLDCSSHRARSGAQEKASWSSIVPHLGPLLSRETSSVPTSTKIVEETSKNSPQTKGRRCQDRWRDWRWSVRMSVRVWCQGR